MVALLRKFWSFIADWDNRIFSIFSDAILASLRIFSFSNSLSPCSMTSCRVSRLSILSSISFFKPSGRGLEETRSIFDPMSCDNPFLTANLARSYPCSPRRFKHASSISGSMIRGAGRIAHPLETLTMNFARRPLLSQMHELRVSQRIQPRSLNHSIPALVQSSPFDLDEQSKASLSLLPPALWRIYYYFRPEAEGDVEIMNSATFFFDVLSVNGRLLVRVSAISPWR